MTCRLLITGYQRSGTTLLRRLMCQHPDMAHVIHEGRILNKVDTNEGALDYAQKVAASKGKMFNPKQVSWGDKVPFSFGFHAPVAYYRKWIRLFGKKARVVFIVRHPYDVANSSEKTFGQSSEKILQSFSVMMPEMLKAAREDEIMVIKFEELVADPVGVLRRVFKYCDLSDDEQLVQEIATSGRSELRYFDNVEKSRAFAYKTGTISSSPVNLNTVIALLNEVPGPAYDSEYRFDERIICPQDPTATPERIAQYRDYYAIKHEIIQSIQPKVIAEIGVRAGYSAWVFMSACPNAMYHGFDADNGTHGGQGGPWTWWAERILEERGFKFQIHAPVDTQKMEYFPIVADFYHIDGDHTPNGVYHDLKICFRSSSVGAVMLVDDYDYDQAAGVRIGVDKWLQDFSEFVEAEHIPSLRGEMLIRVTSK